MVTSREKRGVTPNLCIPRGWKKTPCIKPAAKKGHFIYKLGLENSCHDSGKWPGSRMLRKQNIKVALCVGVGSK